MSTFAFLFGLAMIWGITPGVMAGSMIAGALTPGATIKSLLWVVVGVAVVFVAMGHYHWFPVLGGLVLGFCGRGRG